VTARRVTSRARGEARPRQREGAPREVKLEPVPPGRTVRLRDADARLASPFADPKALERATKRLCKRLGKLQRVFWADGRNAMLIVLQGRDASGKDGTIRKVFGAVNPQGCTVSSFTVPTEVERSHDYLWRVHMRVPPRGMIGIFNRSHYEDILVPRVHQLVSANVWRARHDEVNDFERMLAANDVVILKFMLHISGTEQKRRLQERIDDETKNWKFRAGDLDDRRRWPQFAAAYREILRRTSTPWAPWFVVPADDKRLRNYLIARTVTEAMERLRLRYPPADPAIRGLAID
jgi:PPK2 family polyphosphate:nucleotide phosphotransferase